MLITERFLFIITMCARVLCDLLTSLESRLTICPTVVLPRALLDSFRACTGSLFIFLLCHRTQYTPGSLKMTARKEDKLLYCYSYFKTTCPAYTVYTVLPHSTVLTLILHSLLWATSSLSFSSLILSIVLTNSLYLASSFPQVIYTLLHPI